MTNHSRNPPKVTVLSSVATGRAEEYEGDVLMGEGMTPPDKQLIVE